VNQRLLSRLRDGTPDLAGEPGTCAIAHRGREQQDTIDRRAQAGPVLRINVFAQQENLERQVSSVVAGQRLAETRCGLRGRDVGP